MTKKPGIIAAVVANAGGAQAVAAGMRVAREDVETWAQRDLVPSSHRWPFGQLCADLAGRKSYGVGGIMAALAAAQGAR